jgi:DNA-directed RNA polymerase specialized sigma24 family protein
MNEKLLSYRGLEPLQVTGIRRRRSWSVQRPIQVEALMANGVSSGEAGRAQRFHDAALPHLDAVYTLARYLLRHSADAEDAVEKCYQRAFSHFDSFRGTAVKPWLLAILRNICRAEYPRRAKEYTQPAESIDAAEVLVHASLDGELDAGHAREAETHLEGCQHCSAQLAVFRSLRQAVTAADLRLGAPAALRQRIEKTLPLPPLQWLRVTGR